MGDLEIARAIVSVRNHFAFFGFPLDGVTDEQLLQNVQDAGRQMAELGVTMNQAATAIQALNMARTRVNSQR